MARKAKVDRETTETKISVSLNLDGTGTYSVKTPIGFLSHMVEQLSRHSLMDLDVKAEGDVHIDGHHVTGRPGYLNWQSSGPSPWRQGWDSSLRLGHAPNG